MLKKEQGILQDLGEVGAVLRGSHFVYKADDHGSDYVNKDAVYPHVALTSRLCGELAEQFQDDRVEVVVAPAVGGIALTRDVARHLEVIMNAKVFAVFAEKEVVAIPDPEGKGRKCFAETGDFVLNRGYREIVHGRNVLVVEDVLNFGGSARKVVDAVRTAGGTVVGVGALCKRGGVTIEDLDVPELVTLVDVKLDKWPEADCPLCKAGVPINTQVGKGREFLERRRTQA